jgi:hypothetical protein
LKRIHPEISKPEEAIVNTDRIYRDWTADRREEKRILIATLDALSPFGASGSEEMITFRRIVDLALECGRLILQARFEQLREQCVATAGKKERPCIFRDDVAKKSSLRCASSSRA